MKIQTWPEIEASIRKQFARREPISNPIEDARVMLRGEAALLEKIDDENWADHGAPWLKFYERD